ncbi:MAG TPA: LPS assembly lipoprotein LptE, partial [Opitutales bacterium]|nr:LPS assembly lipoprotein LptE [Opitutales bacterium]
HPGPADLLGGGKRGRHTQLILPVSGNLPFFRAAFLTLAAIALAACSSYKPGGGSATGFHSIWIAPAVNESYLPRMGTAVAEQLRNDFLRDNSVRLATREEAETRQEITVTGVTRLGRATGQLVHHATEINGQKVIEDTEDSGLDKAYDITVTVRAILSDATTGTILLDKSYDASSQAQPNPYLLSNADDEMALLPIIARDIARRIHDDLAQGWE